MDLTTNFNNFIEANRQTIGNSIFDAAAGAIKGGLQSNGVELQSQVVPIAKNSKKENSPDASSNMQYVYIAGGLVLAFLVYKKLLKKRV